MSKLILSFIIGFIGLQAQAMDFPSDEYFRIDQVEIEEIASESIVEQPNFQGRCLRQDWVSMVDSIINIGQKIWKIVEAGRPTLNFKDKSASAVPSDAKCLAELANWQMPESKSFRMKYKNGFGMNVITFEYKVIYSYGGSYKGKGRYLANVSVHPQQVNVSWGFKFDANVEIMEVLNLGSQEDQMAGMQLAVRWNVSSVIQEQLREELFFVQGDGQFRQL